MKKLQNLISGDRSSNIKWQEPGLIDLTRSRQRAQGDCNTGSGDSYCYSNGLAANSCETMGVAAL